METASALLAAGLAVVFGLSGVGKLRALDESAATLRALRLRAATPRLAVGTLAVIELVITISLLLPPPVFSAAASAAGVLCLVFLIVVLRAYLLGSREDCGCFGEGGTPISVRLILRNAALLLAAMFASVLGWRGAGGLPEILSALPDNATVLLAVAAGLLATVLWLSRPASSTLTTSLVADTAAATDEQHPHIVLVEQHTGIPRDLSAAARWRSQLLVFVKPGCGSCDDVMAELDRREGALSLIVTPALIISVPAGQAPREDEDERFLLDPADLNAARIGTGSRRPVAALLATDGSIVQPLAYGRDEIVELLEALAQAAR